MTLGLFFAAASSFFLTDQSYRISMTKKPRTVSTVVIQVASFAGGCYDELSVCRHTLIMLVVCEWRSELCIITVTAGKKKDKKVRMAACSSPSPSFSPPSIAVSRHFFGKHNNPQFLFPTYHSSSTPFPLVNTNVPARRTFRPVAYSVSIPPSFCA